MWAFGHLDEGTRGTATNHAGIFHADCFFEEDSYAMFGEINPRDRTSLACYLRVLLTPATSGFGNFKLPADRTDRAFLDLAMPGPGR